MDRIGQLVVGEAHHCSKDHLQTISLCSSPTDAFALLQMDRIGLLVFDEAHYCSKDHAYAQIMEDFYHTAEPQHRPQVLGLTASPRGLHGSGKKLETGVGGGATAVAMTAGWDLQRRLAAPLLTVAPELR
jgi:superfamily II DNA or RNA helicase